MAFIDQLESSLDAAVASYWARRVANARTAAQQTEDRRAA